MKAFLHSLLLILSLVLVVGCNGNKSTKPGSKSETETTSVADTGFTGIKQIMSGTHLVMEVTLKNGVREGLTKSFYASSKLRQTFWYENGLREDSVKWYYEEGQLFRSTPYKHDTIDGTQKQYYKNGRLRAKLVFKKGLRTQDLEEFSSDGKLITGYPELVLNTHDEYKTKGVYIVSLQLSNKSTNVRYYKGELTGGVFDTAHCEKLKTIEGIGYLNLKKTGSPKPVSVGVIAEILTNFGNNHLVYKKIELPYKDLK